MGRFLRALGLTRIDDAPKMLRRPARSFALDIPDEIREFAIGGGLVALRISRREALQVPAVTRARNLIAGSLGTLPVRVHGPDRKVITDVTYLVPQPDPEVPSSVFMTRTVEDLFFEGLAWWRVTKFGWHNYPVEAEYVDPTRVHQAPNGRTYIDGLEVPDNQIIMFPSPNPALLIDSARAIRTCLLLDNAAALYSKDPLPLGYFSERQGVDPMEREEALELLQDWETSRQERSWGYLGGLEAKVLQWSPEQLQLADARQHAVLEIARASGLDPEELGVSTTSRTYKNAEQRRQDLIDFTFGPYVSAVQDRLSMRDVLPRGYVARIDFAGFLRSDTKTRMETYEVGRRVGAYDDERIAALEDIPVSQVRSAMAQAPKPAAPAVAPKLNGVPAAKFDAEPETRVTFDTPEVAATFRVNAETRTVSGMVVPWGKVARSGFFKWRFKPGSLHWADVGRTKLNRDHDFSQAIGRALKLDKTVLGLDAAFKIARGAAGDQALSLAEDGVLDGFSIEIDFDDDAGDSWEPDPNDESVRLVTKATLRGVALTAMPAFDDARITAVAASQDKIRKEDSVTDTTAKDAAAAVTFDFEAFAKDQAEKFKIQTEALTNSIGESVTAGIKAALENISTPQEDGPGSVRASRFVVTREAPVYSLNGLGHSLVRDAWYAGRERDDDAIARLRKYRQQTEEVAKIASATFATVTTTGAAAVIPPGYRPDLYIPQLQQQRPIVDACSQGQIANATPFTVPVFVSIAGASADHVEGVNPTDGTLTLTTKTVTPQGISGKMILTREIVDSSNPAIDQIALAAMRESYNRQTEVKVYTLFNGANGTGGVITGDLVPSGAQAVTVAGGTDQQTLVKMIRERLAKYTFNRFALPDLALMGQGATVRIATAVDTTQRPLFPSLNPMNANGTGNSALRGWDVDTVPFVPAWAMTGIAAGDTQILITNRSDMWVWESPLLTFRYEEKSGPALIELAMFGYFGAHVLRPVGLSGIRIT